MQINITFRRFEATDALKQYALDKAERVKKHLVVPETAEIHIVLSLERHLHHADVTLYAQGRVVRGHEGCSDMYAAIDLAVERVERQLRRHRDKVRHHHDRALVHHGVNLLDLEQHAREAEEVTSRTPPRVSHPPPSESPRIVRSAEPVETLSVEEAVIQLDLLDCEFLVFNNRASRAMCVVYRRKDGHFVLIDASAPRALEARAAG